MADDTEGPETENDQESMQMPAAPDIGALIQKQQKNLQAMYKASEKMFTAYPARDKALSSLGETLGIEITSVFTIAEAVHTPQQALASIPLVLAAANTAFASIPVTEAAITAKAETAVADFSADLKAAEDK